MPAPVELRTFPDTRLVKEAVDAVDGVLPPPLLAHSYRAFLLASHFADRRRIDFDDEGLLVAALFHDLGLADGRRDVSGPFTRVGSTALLRLFEDQDEPRERAVRLAEAIDFHMRPRPRWKHGPEVGLLHVGAWMDAVSRRAWSVPRGVRQAVRAEYPRRRFQREFNRGLVLACRTPAAAFGLVRPPSDHRRAPGRREGSPGR